MFQKYYNTIKMSVCLTVYRDIFFCKDDNYIFISPIKIFIVFSVKTLYTCPLINADNMFSGINTLLTLFLAKVFF